MIKLVYGSMITITLIFLTGCASSNWAIENTEMSLSTDTIKHNTVLLNTKTGETWLWWTDPESNGPGSYVWKKLPNKQ